MASRRPRRWASRASTASRWRRSSASRRRKGTYLAYRRMSSAARRRSTCCPTCWPACCATWRSRSRCAGTPGSTTAAASCCSGVRSAGSCSLRRPRRALHHPPQRGRAVAASCRRSGRRRVTYGHRFLATSGRAGRAIKVRSVRRVRHEAGRELRDAGARRAPRQDRARARRARAAARRAGQQRGRVTQSGLLQEVPDLVEYPAVVAGTFGAEFLALPEEVLTTTMIHHQHFFPVVNASGRLMPAFLAVTNTQAGRRAVDRAQLRAGADGAPARRAVLLRRRPRARLETGCRACDACCSTRSWAAIARRRCGSSGWPAGSRPRRSGAPDAADAAAAAGRLAKADSSPTWCGS